MDRKQRFFAFLTALFVAALVTGDFVGGKFFVVFGHTFSAGIVPFPLTFVLTDLVNEFYGTHGAKRITMAGLGAAVFTWAVISLALQLPTSPDSPIQDSVFRSAFGTSARLYVASLTAYVIGQLLDISIFHFLRRTTGHRLLWLRSTGSTVVSQVVDSLAVSFVFLVGAKPLGFIVNNALHNYLGKLAMAILLTPLIYAGHGLFNRYFHLPEKDTPATELAA
ncbi:MAG TPA: queuosine precursor transporter [Polyangia bacterium]|nr:queuosine precursor transporter [Polyangia bacterium]